MPWLTEQSAHGEGRVGLIPDPKPTAPPFLVPLLTDLFIGLMVAGGALLVVAIAILVLARRRGLVTGPWPVRLAVAGAGLLAIGTVLFASLGWK